MSIIEDVREAVIPIPAGFVASYGDIGKRIGAAPRQVGRAMSLLDDGVPWWRVVYADGTPASWPQRTSTGATQRGGDTDFGCAGRHEARAATMGALTIPGLAQLALSRT